MRKYITEKLEVDSQAINHMVYNYDSNTLTVKFNYGKEYMYFKVPSDTTTVIVNSP